MEQDVGEAKIRVVYIEKIKSGLERRDVGKQVAQIEGFIFKSKHRCINSPPPMIFFLCREPCGQKETSDPNWLQPVR